MKEETKYPLHPLEIFLNVIGGTSKSLFTRNKQLNMYLYSCILI
jgi:hypothetical protein